MINLRSLYAFFSIISFILLMSAFEGYASIANMPKNKRHCHSLSTRYAVLISTPGCEKRAAEILEYMRANNMNYIEFVTNSLWGIGETKIVEKFLKDEYKRSTNQKIVNLYSRLNGAQIDWNFLIKCIETGFIPDDITNMMYSKKGIEFKDKIEKALANHKKNNINAIKNMLRQAISSKDLEKAQKLVNNSHKKELIMSIHSFEITYEIIKFFFDNGRYDEIHYVTEIPSNDTSEFARLARAIKAMDLSADAEKLYQKYADKNPFIAVLYCMALKARGVSNFDELKQRMVVLFSSEVKWWHCSDGFWENEEYVSTAFMLFADCKNLIVSICSSICHKPKEISENVKKCIVQSLFNTSAKSYVFSEYNVAKLLLNCLLYRDECNDKKAFEYCSKIANKFFVSEFNRCLSVMYYRGIGTSINHKKAFELVSNQNDEDNLPLLYYYHKNGIGTSKNIAKANEYKKLIQDRRVCMRGVFTKERNPQLLIPIEDHQEFLNFIENVYLLCESVQRKNISEHDYFVVGERLLLKTDSSELRYFLGKTNDFYKRGDFKDLNNINKIEGKVLSISDKLPINEKNKVLSSLLELKLLTVNSNHQKTFEVLKEYLQKFDFENEVTFSNVFLAEKLAYILDKGKGCKRDELRAEAIRSRIKKFSQEKDKNYYSIRIMINRYTGSLRNSGSYDIPTAKYWIDWFLETTPCTFAYYYAFLYARTIECDFAKFKKYYKLYADSSKENVKSNKLPMFIYSACGDKDFDDIKTSLPSLIELSKKDSFACEWLSYMYHKGLGVEQDVQKSAVYFEKFIKSRSKYSATASYKYIRGEYGFTDIAWAKKIYDASINTNKLSVKEYPTFEAYIEFIKKKSSIFY